MIFDSLFPKKPKPKEAEQQNPTVNSYMLTCSRCNASWIPRKKTPKKCPVCTSPYWNKPRVKNVKRLAAKRESRTYTVQ